MSHNNFAQANSDLYRLNNPISGLRSINHISIKCLDLLCLSMPFSSLPLLEALHVFHQLQRVEVNKGDMVVRQDAFGDDFYIILSGRADVWYESEDDDKPHVVAVLEAGEAFGEEAIVLRGAQYSTVLMKEDGVLLKLSGELYRRHIAKKVIRRTEAHIAKAMLDHGALLLDVRYLEEHEDVKIPGDFFIPLHELRHRVSELPIGQEIIVYCRTGIRSDLGAMLLEQYGCKASSLIGGIVNWPYKTCRETTVSLMCHPSRGRWAG